MMIKRNLLSIFGAALLLSAAPVASGAGFPAGAAQKSSSSSSTAAKKKKRAAAAKSKRRPKVKGQTAPTPDRIKEIQGALQKDGSYEGEPTGKWDAATVDAMKKYQDKNGFPSTGKIDAASLNKLGLGSDTAGKGAPVPPPSSSPANSLAAPADSQSKQ
jgi:peptidoglycan hydrolase-like protein with peptidoglycan-binding domain